MCCWLYRKDEKRVLARLATAKYLRSLIILGTENNFDTAQEAWDQHLSFLMKLRIRALCFVSLLFCQ
jgi:hypothetical protein